ncbi:MAG: TspO/MBR family protein [Bacteroidia bacterium]
MKNSLTFAGCLLLTLGVGFIAGIATANSINGWYLTLNKPFFNPPNYLFGPVWTLLYILMGISLYLIIKAPKSIEKPKAYILFFIQLMLNFFWSFIFFLFQSPLYASIEIIVLWLFIISMIIQFTKISKVAAWINIPYLAWVSFATCLSVSIYLLNK